MKSVAFIFFFVFCPALVYSAQNAIVSTDGAMVYRKSNFDSQVIGYMRAGQKVRISSKMFGGAFYRVQFKQGVLGYIADTDVEVQSGGRSSRNKDSAIAQSRSFITKKYIGLSLGQLKFSEVFNQSSVNDDLLFYGVKYTGPFKWLNGPFVLDSNFLYHSGYPSYYDAGSVRGESGRIALLDATLNYSFFESSQKNFWFYFGAGPLLSYSSFVVEISSSKKDLTEIQFGGVLTAGGAIRFGKFAFKIEPKYYILESSYFGISGALQFEF